MMTVRLTHYFTRRAESRLDEDELTALINLVAFNPTIGVLIGGTGGLRKVRIGLGGRGKSGGARVIY